MANFMRIRNKEKLENKVVKICAIFLDAPLRQQHYYTITASSEEWKTQQHIGKKTVFK